MKASIIGAAFACALAFAGPVYAAPDCLAPDNSELCALADNPSFAAMRAQGAAGEAERATRHSDRRARARLLLGEIGEPTWRDLYRAGYVISYGDTPEEDLLAHAIAIRALSLAPDEADARFLVAMTIDAIGRRYVGVQLYGRQKFFQLDPDSGAVRFRCLPQMIDPPLPASVGVAFHDVGVEWERCPPGVGELR